MKGFFISSHITLHLKLVTFNHLNPTAARVHIIYNITTHTFVVNSVERWDTFPIIHSAGKWTCLASVVSSVETPSSSSVVKAAEILLCFIKATVRLSCR